MWLMSHEIYENCGKLDRGIQITREGVHSEDFFFGEGERATIDFYGFVVGNTVGKGVTGNWIVC